MIKKTFLALAIASCTAFVHAQTPVAEFVPGATSNGLNYALPRTIIKADVHVAKVTYTPGEYAKYAKRFLHINDVKTEPSKHWEIKRIDFRTEGAPDTLKYFTMKLNGKNTPPYVQMDKNGLLLAVNTNVDVKENIIPVKKSSSPYIDGKQYLTEEILMATSMSKIAELVANEIMAIRESKNDIKRGQAESMPKDGASMRMVLDELNKQEDALTRLFTGYTDTIYSCKTYTYDPTKEVQNDIFFRFSSKLGFVDSDDLAGEPFYITIKDKHTVLLPGENETKKRKLDGLVYNMPSIAHITIKSLNSSVYDRDIPIAQFGTIDQLSPALFTKGATTKVIFDGATGGILKLAQ